MPSNNASAAAPIVNGILLVGIATREVVQHGFEIWTALALAGGLSAVGVGIDVLAGFGGFEAEERDGRRNWTRVGVARLALTYVAVGAGIGMAETTLVTHTTGQPRPCMTWRAASAEIQLFGHNFVPPRCSIPVHRHRRLIGLKR